MIEGVQVVDLVIHEDDWGYLVEIARHANVPELHGVVYQLS